MQQPRACPVLSAPFVASCGNPSGIPLFQESTSRLAFSLSRAFGDAWRHHKPWVKETLLSSRGFLAPPRQAGMDDDRFEDTPRICPRPSLGHFNPGDASCMEIVVKFPPAPGRRYSCDHYHCSHPSPSSRRFSQRHLLLRRLCPV